MIQRGNKETKIKKILVANRGEIAIRVFRACTELNIRTVAIYANEDKSSYHRFKADEAYLVGEGKGPIEAYLDIEGIIEIAKRTHVDAIHPGYGFLSENETFAKRCQEEGLLFIGPKSEQLEVFGDKVKARKAAIEAGIPVIPGSNRPIQTINEAIEFGKEQGYPLILKAILGAYLILPNVGIPSTRLLRASNFCRSFFLRYMKMSPCGTPINTAATHRLKINSKSINTYRAHFCN
ncbi:MAG TPA: biotin carboxylase N-terminal domain-containing protein, partial [Massilibacterium sp.]|nr:biotin carboxylase N-terminal domain-containing protein [Massilibacterium sp.]